MKNAKTLLAATLIAGLALTGCSSASAPSIEEGTENMLKLTAELKEAAASGDQEKIKDIGHELDETWEGYEDSVKDKSKETYEQIEDALSPTIAATEADTLDKEALNKFNDELTAALEASKGL